MTTRSSFPLLHLLVFFTWLLVYSATHADDDIDISKLPAPSRMKIDFVKHIRPIFQAKCFSCHGAQEQEGGLRLDLKQSALDGGDSGHVIVLRKSAESLLIHAIAGLDEETQMPPADEGTPLNDEQVALVRAWIDQGAVWPDDAAGSGKPSGADHWAFQPFECPQPPRVKNKDWVRNEIDAFILERLEREDVEPSREADRATLIRRVYLDLIGLPPSSQQFDRAMTDSRSDWYEHLVRDLLDSPHYGERWARHWLDLARYADSDGYEKDKARPHAWRWREWVINALNDDKPFDQFTIEQLAGDLLPNATLEQKVATGFHRNTLINREGGTDPEEDRVKRTVDRTNTLGSVWLGMTVECGQCHSHKYDPLTQKEYYQFYAFFNTMAEPDIGAPLADQMAAYEKAKAAFDKEHQQHVAAVQRYEKEDLSASLKKWEKSSPDTTPVWTILRPESVSSKKGTTLTLLDDGSILASGEAPGRQEVYQLVCKTDLTGITGIRIEAIGDERLPGGGPRRGPLGNFSLTRFDVSAAPSDGSTSAKEVTLAAAQADFSQSGHGVERAMNTNPVDGWSIGPRFGENHVATFETKQPIEFDEGTTLTIAIWQSSVLMHYHNLGRFRISVSTTDKKPLPLYGVTDVIAQTLTTPTEKRSEMMQQDLLAYFGMIDEQLVKLRMTAMEHGKKAPTSPYLTTKAQVVAAMKEPRETHFLIRGDFLKPSYKVQPNVPAALNPLKARGSRPDRLDLAQWLIDPANPLTSRVTVNRIWARYFGRGIVPSERDLGTQGEIPSHAELLDWLATSFRENGWSMKKLHTLIVTSATYRQSSVARPELAKRDPYNAWLSHQNRLRVEGEIVRDLALSASGLIKHRIGGPSVRPPQPAGVAALGYAGSVRWQTSKGDDRYRRGLYTFFQRTVPYPMSMTFDAPDSNLTCTKRARSNTPLQALTLWNDPVFFEAAQALGKRIVREIPASQDNQATVNERIRHAFRLCLSRDPFEKDLEIVRKLYEAQHRLAAADLTGAATIVGDKEMSSEAAADLAAWIIVSRTLINLDEFITRG